MLPTAQPTMYSRYSYYPILPRECYTAGGVLDNPALDTVRDRIKQMFPGVVDNKYLTPFDLINEAYQDPHTLDIAAVVLAAVAQLDTARVTREVKCMLVDPTYIVYKSMGFNVYDRLVSPALRNSECGPSYRSAIIGSLRDKEYRLTALLYTLAEQITPDVATYEAKIRDGSLDVLKAMSEWTAQDVAQCATQDAPKNTVILTIEVPDGCDVDKFRESVTRFTSVAALKSRQPSSVLRDMVRGKIDPAIVRQFLKDDIDPRV